MLHTACGSAPRRRPPPPPIDEAAAAWAPTLASARRAVLARDYRAAESTLVAFADRWPASSSAAEARYWWALAQVDPANRGADRAAGLAALDAYMATDPPRRYVAEAGVIRALAGREDSLRLALALERASSAAAAAAADAAVAAARAGLVPRDSLRARDDEVAKLRAEVTAAQAELERVRRRLAAPSGPERRP